ncbi:SDR family oxidoreductase [Paraburkholderia metrosideri]|uniref:Oxidoreductase n=1 Tax=Paraburkholderia metrosideri TaxID=580937 RepID=A0ABM8NBT9_9BURK|nr:SDR family oxidoreductase [Paraburkholderia metrosideri]CAD6516057.1 putative oxidoreductase [Paraburkholderia metrosideri]
MVDGIEGEVIVIAGASSGVGAAAARHLAEGGARLFLGARRTEWINTLARELSDETPGLAVAVPTDVTDAVQVRHLVDEAVSAFGRVDGILNNAGVMPLSPLDRYKVEEWDGTIDVNIKGVLYGIAAALPHMQAQKSGHIINVASVAGHTWFPTGTVTAARSGPFGAISEGGRQEVKPYDIRTTISWPRAVATELLESISEADVLEATRKATSIAIPADSFARMVAFAISQPDDVDVNEILFRPTRQQGWARARVQFLVFRKDRAATNRSLKVVQYAAVPKAVIARRPN